MKIDLNQEEIKQAIAAYVVASGISLTGKTLDISFTAGRGSNGLSAGLTIEPIKTTNQPVIPGYTDLTLVSTQEEQEDPVPDEVAEVIETQEAIAEQAVEQDEEAPEPEPVLIATPPVAIKTSSLFASPAA